MYGSHVSYNDKARFNYYYKRNNYQKVTYFTKLMNKNINLLWPVLGLLETFLETVLFLPVLHDFLLLRGEVNGLRHWLHHNVCQNTDDNKIN